MIEVALEDFEKYYSERIDQKYYKIKRVVKKLIADMRNDLIEIKVCMDHFLDTGKEKIEQKAIRTLNFFSDRIKKEIDEVEVPEEEINYENLMALLSSVKKLFNNINEIARKSLPKIKREVQAEIKELNYLTRKLSKKQVNLDNFLRNKYTEVKIAEDLLKKLPKLFTLKDNIERVKIDLEGLEKLLEEKKELQKTLNSSMIELEKNNLFKKLEKRNDKLFKLKLEINEHISFKKALKKLKVELEKETIHISNLDINYLNNFLKNPINTLTKESKDLPKFSSLLIQLRHVLEENKLNLKSDKKEKTVEHINIIFEEKPIHRDISKLEEVKSEIKAVESEIKEAGLAAKLEEVKNQVSSNTLKIEHIENDLNRKNKDYLRYLGTLKKDREEFQTSLEAILGEPVKIEITFSF
jgi:hypothetical protein